MQRKENDKTTQTNGLSEVFNEDISLEISPYKWNEGSEPAGNCFVFLKGSPCDDSHKYPLRNIWSMKDISISKVIKTVAEDRKLFNKLATPEREIESV
mgnify:CR=1 FL=1